MKANKAPEKIYLDEDESWHLTNPNGDSVEYIQTDAFIAKAWEWVENNILSSSQQDKSLLYYEQFINYMEGE